MEGHSNYEDAQNASLEQLSDLEAWSDVSPLTHTVIRYRDYVRAMNRTPTLSPSRTSNQRELLSVKLGDWTTRMVFFEGDERETFYAGQTGQMCPALAAVMDPSCRTSRRTHREVAYRCVCMTCQPFA